MEKPIDIGEWIKNERARTKVLPNGLMIFFVYLSVFFRIIIHVDGNLQI